MKKILSLFLILIAGTSFAQTITPKILETGNGFTRLRVTDPQYQATIQDQIINGMKMAQTEGVKLSSVGVVDKTSGVSSLTGEVVVVDTLRGVLAANFPSWLKREIFTAEGYTEETFNVMTEAQLDAKITRRVIDMDALSPLTVQTQSAPVIEQPPTDGMKRIAPAGSMYETPTGWRSFWRDVGDLISDSLCLKKEEDNSKHWSFPLNKNAFSPKEVTEGGFTGSMSVILSTDGTGTAEIFYKVSSRCHIPYSIEFKRAEFKVDTTLGGTIGVRGKASYAYTNKLFSQRFNFQLMEYDFWVYIFQFRIKADLNFDIGANFSFAAMAEVEATYTIGGRAGITWVCTSSNCVRTRVDVNTTPVLKSANGYQAQVEIKLVPFVDTSVGAELNLYWILELVSARVGILSELPVTFFAYAGNMCSDANGDGTPEDVRAAYLDVTAQFSGYFRGTLLGKTVVVSIDLGLGEEYTKQYTFNLESKETFVIYARSLYFKDFLSNGSSILQPVLKIPSISKPLMNISVAKRSCYQFSSNLVYEVNWGDGSAIERRSDGSLSHTYARPGSYTVRVRAVGDTQNRSFETPWMTKLINVSPDGIHPFYPWLPEILMTVLD